MSIKKTKRLIPGSNVSGPVEYSISIGIPDPDQKSKELQREKLLSMSVAEHIEKGGNLDGESRHTLLNIAKLLRSYSESLPSAPKKKRGQHTKYDYGHIAMSVASIMLKENKKLDPAIHDFLSGSDEPSVSAIKKALNKPQKKGDAHSLIESALHVMRGLEKSQLKESGK